MLKFNGKQTVRFVIPGKPCGKGRPRFTGRIAYTPRGTVSYENLVKLAYCNDTNGFNFGNAPIAMHVTAYYPIPKSTSKANRAKMLCNEIYPTKKPDFDNIGKIITDALNGIAYHDDAQIVRFTLLKYYAESPRVEVCMWEVN